MGNPLFFEALAAERPLVVVLDDLQWAQPPLLDLVEHIADWSRDAPILLIVLARQELLEVRPAWGGGKRSATSISLEPLDAEETAQLIDNLLGRADVPPTVFDRIRAAAEGNPLFVEELLEMLIDEGALARTNGNWTARRDLAALAVPPTIQALLAARLDGLGGGERAVLERGAVEGTVFHRDAVAALAPDNLRDAVGSTLQTLTRREFVIPDRAELGDGRHSASGISSSGTLRTRPSPNRAGRTSMSDSPSGWRLRSPSVSTSTARSWPTTSSRPLATVGSSMRLIQASRCSLNGPGPSSHSLGRRH